MAGRREAVGLDDNVENSCYCVIFCPARICVFPRFSLMTYGTKSSAKTKTNISNSSSSGSGNSGNDSCRRSTVRGCGTALSQSSGACSKYNSESEYTQRSNSCCHPSTESLPQSMQQSVLRMAREAHSSSPGNRPHVILFPWWNAAFCSLCGG